ncbi:MAG: YbaK/EbsC family protein [Candidatus Diapherotrites archaeon]|nr:YbaK/EbsC family protein [Candidatus Diapherotrites archaeon]
MLEDFLEQNCLDAEFFSFEDGVSFKKALFEMHTPASSAVKIEFFLANSGEGLLLIFPHNSKPDLQKIKRIAGCESISHASADETLEFAGYEKGFLPPVSIYGVKVFLEKSLQGKEFLFCKVGENDYLKISPDSVAEANEDIKIESFSKPV